MNLPLLVDKKTLIKARRGRLTAGQKRTKGCPVRFAVRKCDSGNDALGPKTCCGDLLRDDPMRMRGLSKYEDGSRPFLEGAPSRPRAFGAGTGRR